MTEPFHFDYCWKVVLKIENEYQRTEDNYQITLTENDKNRILTALVGQDTPRCLKYFLLNSKNTAVANLKPCDAEFMSDGFLRLTLEKETKHSALIQQSDVETCVYQCFKENNCLDLLLLNTENDKKIFPDELLKNYKGQKDGTRQYCQSDKIKVRDLGWDVNLKKKNGALMNITKTEIQIFRDILKVGLKQHANQSKNKTFELYEISFEEIEHSAKLIVTLSFSTDDENILQTTIDTIEKWISSSLKGNEKVVFFYDKESAVEREVATNNPGAGVDAIPDNSQPSSSFSTSHAEVLPPIYSSKSEATIVATAGVSAITDQNNPTSAMSHLRTSHTDRVSVDQTTATKQLCETAGMSPFTSHDAIRAQASAGTDVDHPGVLKFQDLKNQFFTLESELLYNEKEEDSCKAAVHSLNDLVKEEKMQDVRIDHITVTEKSLEIRFAVRDLYCIPKMDDISYTVKRCFDKHKLNSFTVKKGRAVSRFPMQDVSQGFEIMFCLYVPGDLTNEINSIELSVYSKEKYSEEMKRKGTMWKTSIVFPEAKNEIWYKYKLKTTRSFLFLWKNKEEIDQKERSICWDYIQRDIISITSKPFKEIDKDKGIAAHVEDIFRKPSYKIQTAFLEIDNLMLRNSLESSNWNGAFSMILDGPITENICLLLLHCIEKKYVTSEFIKNTKKASKIWAKIQDLGQKSKDICVRFVGEIFKIYEASSATECSPLHFINGTQSILDIPSLHEVLLLRSSFSVHSCSESFSCLQTSLTSILNKDGESELVYDIVCLIFDNIPENEILEGFWILQEFNAPEKRKELKEKAQKRVFANVELIMIEKVYSLNFRALNEIFSKVKGDSRSVLVVQCESNIIYQINNQKDFQHNVWKDLENLCEKNMLFQTIDQQMFLLGAVLKMPSVVKARNFVNYILVNFQNKGSESAKELLETAYDELLGSANGSSSEELISYFKEYDCLSKKQFFLTNIEHFRGKLRSHVSKYCTRSILKIHATVTNLQDATSDLYLEIIEDQLNNQTMSMTELDNFDFLETHWKSVDTRGMAQVFISLIEKCKVDETSSKEDLIDHAIDYATFWTYILGAKGRQKSKLEGHLKYKIMRTTYENIYTNLQNDTYHYSFLQRLKGKSEKKLICVFEFVVGISKPDIQKSLDKTLDFVNIACKQLEVITTVCNEVSSNLSPAYEAVLKEGAQNLQKIKDELKDGKSTICDFGNLEIFENREMECNRNLLQSCEDIKKFLHVRLFWKSINDFFYDEMNKVLALKKRKNANFTSEKKLQLILGLLSTKCISNFKKHMKRIMDDDIPLSHLFHFFRQEQVTVITLSEELSQIAKLIGCTKFPDERKDAIIRCLDLNFNSKKIAALRKFQANINSTIEEKCDRQMKRFEKIQNNYSESEWSIVNTNSLILDLESFVINFNAEVMGVIIEYSNSKHLISFLRGIMEEDIRNLMDAVEEEYFDQYLPLVSHLVEVKEFLHPILHLPDGTTTDVYISQIKKGLQKTEIQEAAVKISKCSKELDSLKSFYKIFSNKTEKTKDRIENILKNGKFSFKLHETECTVKVDQTSYTISDLIDLRSRALLIKSRFENKKLTASLSNMKENLNLFLKTVRVTTDILDTYKQLKVLGYPWFEKVDRDVELKGLEGKKAYLYQVCEEWENDLDNYRQKYSCLKYIKSEQLQLLFNYTKNFGEVVNEENKPIKEADIESIMWYLHQDLKFLLTKDYKPCDSVPRHYLDTVVNCLEDDFKKLELKGKSFPPFIKADCSDVKLSKNLNFICVGTDSGTGLNLILGWFLMKCNKLPLPSQVVLCSDNTSWDELYLLLLRSRKRNNVPDECFCIAFLELLPDEYQRMLINEIEKNDWDNSSLGLIYRGRETDSISTLFRECKIYVQPIHRTLLEKLLQTIFPHVELFTSNFPGLGKTERIRDFAASIEKGIKSLHISGPNKKAQLIERLKQLDLKPYEILHIEIGLADRPEELDIFLFELIMLRYVSFSSMSYVLPETVIALEMANCSNQMMVENMSFSMCFSRNHIEWKNYNNFKCQQVQNSPVQVACAYLGKLDNGDLNTDIDLSSISLINDEKCQSLLRKYFPSFKGINFTIVDAFVSVLGNQLRKFSASSYFQITNLMLMIGEEDAIAVRKIVIESLIQFSKECALRSITSSRDLQHRTSEIIHTSSSDLKTAVMDLALRTKNMIRWENSNHLVVVFHSQDTQTVSAVYRNLKDVPSNIKEMFKSQIKDCLPDYASIESNKLLEVIVKLTRTKQLSKDQMSSLATGYAYTSDNMLKMLMIALRIQSNIPVIVMGETGCGKTSLIRRLAEICDVEFNVLSVHAGIIENDIEKTVLNANNEAINNRGKHCWLFFDEINTSEYVGFISNIICHRELNGNALSPNLSFIAACNPYRVRESNRFTTGLQGKQSEDALSLLAYRVHPLPEILLDFVWDYGTLSIQEEEAYIERMIQSNCFYPHENLLKHLLGESQIFVRQKEGSSCIVSLRDVNRCIKLVKWFKEKFIPQRQKQMDTTELLLKSFIMGLTICYMCRFSNSDDRLEYRRKISTVFESKSFTTYDEKEIARCVKEEQDAIIERMDIPKGIAKNTTLQENIFVLLVCILNKIPLFIVGKPGCSKSLSMQLIRNNMRGKDSRDKFFQKYPKLFYSSFQGSESSTSDGIIKVFERAKKIKKQGNDVLSLVILDEIGLAEISRFNPLKVLHSLLEPETKENDELEVAVVGISNWSLDSAKMNRAIHLSRPDMNEQELLVTGQYIMESVYDQRSLDLLLSDIAKSYLEYINHQPLTNFHGLRDYYSFVKYVSREFAKKTHPHNENDTTNEKKMLLLKGVLRNFGRNKKTDDAIRRTFLKRLLLDELSICDTKELIIENIIDSEARHLMLMLDGDSALGSIENVIKKHGKDFTIILGSKFPDDEHEEYNYRVLNRIILCMEQPQVLILKDLDDIYGSLYDMLNQNYTIVQGQKHCRVALGPFSNPSCEVHDDFKCIVIIDETNVEKTDPPFLNRFEKQQYLLNDILKPFNEGLAKHLKNFVHDLSSYSKPNTMFNAEDSFPIAGEEIFTSLVTFVEEKLSSYGNSTSETQVFYFCVLELLWILKPDCILRANISKAIAKVRNSIEYLIDMYMDLPIHNGLGYYLQQISAVEKHTFSFYEDEKNKQVPFELKELKDKYLGKKEDDECEIGFSRKKIQYQLRRSDGYGAKLVVFTFTTIYCKIQDTLADINSSLYKLSEFKSEKSFTRVVEEYFKCNKKKWLVIHCDIELDYRRILLAKSIVENSRKSLMRDGETKNVCIVIHIMRSTNPVHVFNKINFSTGWTLATLDSIEKPIISLPYIYNKPVLDVFSANEQEFKETIFRELPWAYAKIQYQGISDNMTDVLQLKNSEFAVQFVSEQIQDWISRHNKKDNIGWQQKAACDKHLLETSATINRTLQNYLSSLIQQPLARILYSVENAGLMNCLLFFETLKPELQDVFRKGCKHQEFYNIDAVSTPSGPGCYVINLKIEKMRVPFSKLIFEKLENYKAEVLRDVRRNNIIPGHFKIVDDDKLMESMLSIVRAHSDVIKKDTELLNGIAFTKVVDDLTIDFCQFATSSIKCRLTRKEKTGLMKWIINLLKGNSDVNNFSTFLLTLNLWTWTYFSNIIGVFDLMDFLKTRQKSYDLSNLLKISKKKKKMFKSIEDVVDSTCVKILSQCIKLKDSDVIRWQEGVSKFLTIISKICVTSDKTETLKFFNEFVSVVFTSTTCEFSHLNNFAIHVSKCNWDFKKLEVFETFWKHLESLKKSVEILKLQKIACSFIARCNGTNMKDLVEKEKVNLKAFNLIENGEMFDKSLRFYGHCLRLCLIDYASENEFYKTNKFLQMLENDTSNEDRDKVLCAIHQILCKEDTTSFSALFVMALEEEVFCDVIGEVQLNNITEQNDALLKRLILAQNVVISQCIGIRYNVAVAYLKKFLSVTVTLMLNASYKNKCVLSAIDQLLCKEQKDVTQYFFECLKRSSGELGVFKLSITLSLPMQFLKTSTVCPSSESIGWSLMSLNLVRYCSLPDLLLLTSLCDIKKETALLKRLIEGEIASVASLLCFLHCRLFYVESFSKTADSDRLFLKSLQNAGVCHKNDSVKKLVNHLINQHECQIEILRHSTEKSAESNSLTTFLIHFVNLILINEKRECTLYKAVLHCEVSESKPNKIRSSTKYQIRTCTCNHRIVSSDLSCPWCSSNKISGQFVTVCQPIKKKLISTIVRHILIDAALLTSCLFKDVDSKVVLKEVESREKNIKIRWQELREYLQVDDSEQCQLLMIFLEKVKGIFSDTAFSYSEWDPKYDEELRQLLKNRYHELREDNIRHNEMCRKLGKKVAVKNNENGENTKKKLLFCLTEKPSIHNLYLELHMSKAEDKFPCLNLILENFKMLHFPQFIEGILQWHTLLKTKCSNRLRKVECKNITVDTFINQQNEEIQEDLRKTFKIFTDTWGKIITCIPMLEDHTTTLPSVKELTGSSTMDLCILKDINSTVFQVLNALCSWQNKLLDKVLATCVLFNSKALGFLELGSNKAAFPVVALMDLQPRHIIKSMFRADSKRLELFSQIECTAETRNTNYDFRKLEIEWAFKVFYEKAYILIDETMMFMEFKDDLYGHCVQLLHKVSALIPQTTIESELEAKIKEKLKYDSSQGPQLLTLIGTMTTVIVRRKTTEMRLHLAVFAEQLEKLKLIGLSNSCLLPFREYDLTLNKVVAFYTLLEEINGEKYFKALDIEFRDDIHDSTKQQIIHEISGQITLLRACESAMYVFLHRHLYIRDNDINLQQPIADYLRCTELWKNAKISEQQIILPNLEILLQDVFPQDLLVKHVYNFIKLLKDQVSLHQNETCILKLYQESRNTTRKRSIEGEFC